MTIFILFEHWACRKKKKEGVQAQIKEKQKKHCLSVLLLFECWVCRKRKEEGVQAPVSSLTWDPNLSPSNTDTFVIGTSWDGCIFYRSLDSSVKTFQFVWVDIHLHCFLLEGLLVKKRKKRALCKICWWWCSFVLCWKLLLSRSTFCVHHAAMHHVASLCPKPHT